MLTVGQRIISRVKTVDGLLEDEWVVLELLNQKNRTPRIRIKVEKASPHMSKFLTAGKEYVLRQGMRLGDDEHHVWVVPDKQMKATSSQVLLYDLKEGASMDIDF